AAARGQTQCGGAGEQRATTVTGLGTHVGADQAGHGALRVVHGGVHGLDGAAVHVRGAAVAAYRLAHECVAGLRDVLVGAVVQVHHAGLGDRRVGVLHDPVVVAGEAGTGTGAQGHRLRLVGEPGRADVRAVTRGEEELGTGGVAHVEAE